jgi:DNA-binding NtrC family response regulator
MDGQIIILTPETAFRDALKLVCAGHGCRVETATSIEAALALTDRLPVRALIAETNVQGDHDVVELVKAIQLKWPAVSCFLIVDEEGPEVRDLVEKEPWLRSIQKPISMLQFSADLADAIARSMGALGS